MKNNERRRNENLIIMKYLLSHKQKEEMAPRSKNIFEIAPRKKKK